MTELAAGLPALAAVVFFGAVFPVVPTGAAVSAAAAVAVHSTGPRGYLGLVGVVAAGAVGAWAGDVVVYDVCRRGGHLLNRRLHPAGAAAGRVAAVLRRVEGRAAVALTLGRLVPAGRLPVLAALAARGYPRLRFTVADVPAALAWSLCYAAFGVLGGLAFQHVWQAVLAAVLLVLAVTLITGRLRPAAAWGKAAPRS